jgi:hypothetical protein
VPVAADHRAEKQREHDYADHLKGRHRTSPKLATRFF